MSQLENVVIANALQLEAARRRFNFVARAKFELPQPVFDLSGGGVGEV